MTDELDIVKKAITQYEVALRLKRLNEELFDQLLGSIVWLFKYSEKYNIPLPKREELYLTAKRAESLVDSILEKNKQLSDETRQSNNHETTDDKYTEPKRVNLI